MSLILEALKKSEQQRRLGEMPTLGTPTLPSRRRRSVLPVLAGLVAVAIGAGWWLMRTPAPMPDEVKPPAAAPAAPSPAIAERTAAAPARAEQKPAATKPPVSAPVAAAPILPMPTTDRPGAVALPPNAALVGTPGTKPAAPPAAAPVRTPTAPARPAPATASADATPNAAAKTASEAKTAALSKKDAITETKPESPKPAATPAAKAPPSEAKAVENAIAAKPAVKPAAPKLPTVWELPYGTRKDLPDLKLTMHVYSSVPAERFIVIDGTRHVEGDDLGDGVVLREISTDGMVLDFKGQRFLYPRDGR